MAVFAISLLEIWAIWNHVVPIRTFLHDAHLSLLNVPFWTCFKTLGMVASVQDQHRRETLLFALISRLNVESAIWTVLKASSSVKECLRWIINEVTHLANSFSSIEIKATISTWVQTLTLISLIIELKLVTTAFNTDFSRYGLMTLITLCVCFVLIHETVSWLLVQFIWWFTGLTFIWTGAFITWEYTLGTA